MTDKVVRNGEVAVLVSYGYGAGWSTWEGYEGMEFDPRLVEWIEAGKPGLKDTWDNNLPEDITKYLEEKYDGVYLGGVKDLEIEWIPEGSAFRITEYDGSESIECKDTGDWNFA